MRVLLVEDDKQAAAFVVRSLKEHGHTVDHAIDGREGVMLGTSSNYDAMIVDRMLPGLDGLSLIRTLRASGNQTPVLILTTKTQIADRVEGLEAGADDYLVKPFAFSELHARLNALARRPPLVAVETMLRVHDLELDLLKRSVMRGGAVIVVRPQEFKLLEYLMRHAGRVVTRTMLLENVWDFHFDPMTKIVETHISRLRDKIDKGFAVQLIHTVRGAGYMLRAPN